MQPDLKLQYNSQDPSQDGAFGYGWSASIPFISRVNKTGTDRLYTDNYFTSSLSGDLVLVSGTSYAPRVDNGDSLKYTLSSNTWTVTDKKGTVYTFGSQATTRLDNPTDSTKVFKWMLEKVQDTNGNFISYSYYKDSAQIYPSSIGYTSNGSNTGIFEVDFLRQSRTDAIASYGQGFLATTNYRVNEIDVKTSGSITRKYVLSYTTGDNSLRSILHTVTQSGTDEATGNTVTLPAVTFTHKTNASSSGWTINSNWNLPEAISYDGSALFADLNGDGLTDLMVSYTSGSTTYKKTYMNNGDGTWTVSAAYQPPLPFVDRTSGGGWNFTVQDINGDGLPDLIAAPVSCNGLSSCTTTSKIYLNTGSGWALQSYSLPTPLTWQGASLTTIADLNGDGLPDFYTSSFNINGIYQVGGVYINNGDGTWTNETSSWTFPYPSNDGNTNYVDLNGDGIADIVHITYNYQTQVTSQNIYLGTGTGQFVASSETFPGLDLSFIGQYTPPDFGIRFADLNGDGLMDMVLALNVSTLHSTAYINTGSGFVQSSAWAPTTAIAGLFGPVASLLDISGDGLPDIVANPTTGIFLNNGSKTDLLSNLSYSQGGAAGFVYKPSTGYRDGSGHLLNPSLPLVLPTVYQITQFSGSGNYVPLATYSYQGGSYYYNASSPTDRKFAGFASITNTDVTNNTTKTYFHTGSGSDGAHGEYNDDYWKIGKPYRIEVSDSSGNLYSKTINKWTDFDQGGTNRFVSLAQTLNQSYDGGTTHKDKALGLVYGNTTGNLTQKTEYGAVSGNDDGTFTDTGSDLFTTSYTYAAGGSVVGLPDDVTVTNQSSAKVKESKYLYDSQALGAVTLGNLTEQDDWISGTHYAATKNSYDGTYGLITQVLDPRNNATNYSYDTNHLYPATVTNALTQSTSYTYDYSSGQVRQMTDPNTRVFVYKYDGLDRLLESDQPDLANPSTQVAKVTYTYTDTSGAVSIQQTSYLDASNTVSTYTYFDGLNRKIQDRKTEAAANYQVKDYQYDSRGLMNVSTLPYFSTGSAETAFNSNNALNINYAYDPLQRLLTTTNNLGTTTNTYSPWKLTVTDPNGKTKDTYKDAYGNLVQVDEHNAGSTYSTYYTYDYLGDLLSVTDALSNVRNFTYDGLGRRLSAQDLHAPGDSTFGTYTYTYDDAGNLTSRLDPNSQTTNYTYDALNRASTEDFTGTTGTDVTYAYDSGTDGTGRLASVTKLDGTNTAYTYNPLGGIKSETETIGGSNYTTAYTYDRQSHHLTIANPDNSQIQYSYDAGGLLNQTQRKESGDSGFTSVVSSTTYSPLEQPAVITYANGAVTTNTYDSTKLYRLTTKVTIIAAGSHAQDLSYTYDPVGNITQIVDASSTDTSKTANYGYDDLYRLTSSTITAVASGQSAYTENYTYNAIGDLTSKTGPGSYTYAGNTGSSYANPHAATSIGSNTLTYDNNGNTLSYGAGSSTIAPDATTTSITNAYNGSITKTWTLTTSSGTNRLLVLEGDLWQDVPGTGSISSPSYNGVALTKAASSLSGAMDSEIWYLVNPASGANTVSVTVTGATDAIKLASSTFTGAAQTAPFVAAATNTGSSGNPMISRTTTQANSLLVSTLSRYSTTAASTNRTSLYNNATGSTLGAASYQVTTTTGSYSDTYTGSSANDWSMVMAEFKPAGSGNTYSYDYNNRLTQATAGGITSNYAYDYQGNRVETSDGTANTIYPTKFYNTDGTTATKHIFDDKGTLLATVQSTGGGSGSISPDATTTSITNAYNGGPTTKTWTHTTSSGTNRILELEADIWQDTAGAGTVSSASYNGAALTKVTSSLSGGMDSEIWYLVNPASGTNTVSVTITGATDAIKLSVSTFTGALQSSPVDVTSTATGTSGNPSASLTTTAANDLVLATLSRYSTTAASTNRTSLYNNATGSTLGAASYQIATSAGAYSDTYTGSDPDDWSMSIVSFKPAGSSPTVTVHYVHTDQLTGSNVITNSSDTKDEILDYYPFGSMRFDEKPGGYSDQRKFAGSQFDSDTGLNYLGARYLDTTNGRFMSEDQAFLATGDRGQVKAITGNDLQAILSDPQSLNSYSYARNNPLTVVDPNGAWGISFGLAFQLTKQAIGETATLLGNYAAGQYQAFQAMRQANSQWISQHPQLSQLFINIGAIAGGGIDFSPAETEVAGVSSPLNGSKSFDPVAQQKAWLEGVENPAAQNLIKDVFRPQDTTPGGTIGALQKELETGELTGGKSHLIKAQDTLNRINNIESSQQLNSTEQSRLNTIKDSIKALFNK